MEDVCLQSSDVAAASSPGVDIRPESSGGGGEEEARGANAGSQGGMCEAAKAVAVIDVGGMTCAICVGVVERLLGR